MQTCCESLLHLINVWVLTFVFPDWLDLWVQPVLTADWSIYKILPFLNSWYRDFGLGTVQALQALCAAFLTTKKGMSKSLKHKTQVPMLAYVVTIKLNERGNEAKWWRKSTSTDHNTLLTSKVSLQPLFTIVLLYFCPSLAACTTCKVVLSPGIQYNSKTAGARLGSGQGWHHYNLISHPSCHPFDWLSAQSGAGLTDMFDE